MNPRLVFACLLAASVGLPNAVISTAKALAVFSAIFILLWPGPRVAADHAVGRLRTPVAVLAALGVLALSLLWTTVPDRESLGAWVKHAKLIVVPLLVLLLRTRREALIALGWFVGAQVFTLLSSWLLVLGAPVPWATEEEAHLYHGVFLKYLAQSIMSAVLAAVCWHLRAYLPQRWMRGLAIVVAALALASTLFVMLGRSGHVVAVAMLTLALFWQLPRRLRPAGVLVPFVVGALLMLVSDPLRERATEVVHESRAFLSAADKTTSSGERLNYWHRAVQAIADRPWTGHGVGSFNQQYLRFDGGSGNPQTFGVRNPHQEFLMWGVELGVGGMVLLAALLLCMYRDVSQGDPPARRAAISVLVALVIACMFNSTLYDAAIGDFFCVAIGLLMALCLRTATLERAA